MKALTAFLISILSTSYVFARNGYVSDLNQLPSQQINCASFEGSKKTFVSLQLASSNAHKTTGILNGRLEVRQNGVLIKQIDNIDVLISNDLTRIQAGFYNMTTGLESSPLQHISLRAQSGLGQAIAQGSYTGVVRYEDFESNLISDFARSNAICVFAKK